MINVIDVIIIFIILFSGIIGFKRGLIRSGVGFIGSILVLIIAYSLKNPVANFLMVHLPFIDLSGIFKGVTVINILIYEAIAFLSIFSILQIILNLIINFSKILEGILKATIILGIPSKILGGIFGLLEGYIYAFVLLSSLSLFSFSIEVTQDSKLNNIILNQTPILTNFAEDSYESVSEIYEIKDKYEEIEDKDEYNEEAVRILLKHKVISRETLDILIKQGKVKVRDYD